jgi:hypothetical protein
VLRDGLPYLSLYSGDPDKAPGLLLQPSALSFVRNKAAEIRLSAGEEGPSVSLFDSQGFSSVIGAVNLVGERTGEKHATSAASVHLFGKDRKVLWSAP